MYSNPLKEYLNDEQFEALWEKGFLNERAIRDHYIREKFATLKSHHKPKDIISQLQQEFGYLSTETIRKIVYSREQALENFTY